MPDLRTGLGDELAQTCAKQRGIDQLIGHVVASDHRRNHQERKPAIQHLASDHSDGITDRVDSATAYGRRVDYAEQFVGERGIGSKTALDRRIWRLMITKHVQ